MALTASQLRSDIYRILDQVLTTGIAVEVERRGRLIRISPVEAPSKLSRLEPHPDYLLVDPEDIVSIDWSAEWKP